MKRADDIMKKVYVFLGVVVFGILLVVLITRTNSRDDSDNDKTLNVLNWTSYIPSEVIKGFETEYDVKVNYGTYS